jgi:alkanesulfonate monooxygenase SsuD/methylene tetrahydromethanopterin reductase-like flavin-dependent oxidoreductase (luciferase family)
MDYGRPVQFGVFITPDATHPQRALDLAMLADELGFDLIGVQDHPYQRRFYDTWTLLVAMAMRTERVTVFPDVANLPLRPPAVLAKAAASLDLLSGGRVELGLGAGGFWDAVKAMGGPVRTPGESVTSLEEAIRVIRAMWTGERGLRVDGKLYRLDGVNSGPVPSHPIGIWVGAYKPRMLNLIGRAADGWVPSLGYVQPADLLQANERIDAAATAAGRDPKAIRRVLNMGYQPADVVVALALDYGMDTFLVSEEEATMREFASRIAPKIREEVESRRLSRAH